MAVTNLQQLTVFLSRRVGAGVKKSVRVVVPGQGVVRVLGPEVTNVDGPADVTVTISPETLQALGDKSLDPLKALTSGRIQVSNKLAALGMAPGIIATLGKKPAAPG